MIPSKYTNKFGQSYMGKDLLLICWANIIRTTLDEGPRSRDQWIQAILLVRSRDQWIQAILLVESFKLVPRPLDEGPRPKSGKLRLNLHGTCLGGKINWFGPKKNSAKRRAPDLENQRIRLGTKVESQLKDSTCCKSVQIGS